MPRRPSISKDRLTVLLMRGGPISATEMAAATGVNRSTMVRTLSSFGRELVTIGSTRATRYLLRRTVPGAGDQWPVYRLSPGGKAEPWAMLESFHDRQWRVTWHGETPQWADAFCNRNGMWGGFPFFLSDLRPQGFIGRSIARQLSRFLEVPDDPRQWSDEHTLLYLKSAGEDLPGDIVVGENVLRQALNLERAAVVAQEERAIRYPLLAEEGMRTLPGSSAGGEQPKFLTRISDPPGGIRDVLVKYSPPLDQTTGRRWADLLACESIALGILVDQGLALTGARCFDLGGRRYLEVPRFDRTPAGGRRGVVSLSALCPEADTHGLGLAWPRSAADLLQRGFINEDTRREIARLHAFGELIGNTDRHGGNLSFWLVDLLPFRLAPAYDMLPMFWAPGPQGEIHQRGFQLPPPMPGDESLREEVRPWAKEFWERVGESEIISDPFRRMAKVVG